MIENFAIHTAVLVGLVVTWLWTERLGGVFAGFAVPGYLGAIALVAPASAATLVIEAILTYAIVWLLGEGAARLGAWSRVFGRERFLLFVVVSIPVRLVVEGLAAGGLQEMLGPLLPDGAGDGFFSVGLVLVPLLANTFWKPGLVRGLGQVAITTAITLALLTVVVMPITGLQFSSFFLSFEDIALAFLAVPKVYVILLCTAVVATWTAERFGFNAGGLLVPALLGLLVLEPTKLLTTLLEIIVLTLTYRGVTSLPLIRGLQLSGARRLVTMYLLAWGLKLAFAWIGQQAEIPVATWNLYGFGYLLSSLVAVRCLDLRPMGRVLLPLGFNLGAGAGIGLLASAVLSGLLPGNAGSGSADPPTGPRLVAGDVVLAGADVREDPAAVGPLGVLLRGLPQVMADPTARPGGVEVSVTRASEERPCTSLRAADSEHAGPRAWWCGGSGPVLVVASPTRMPDAVWVAAWALQEGSASGVVLVDVDDGLRAEQVVRALATRLPVDRPIVLVEVGEGGSRMVGAGADVPVLRLPGQGAAVPVSIDVEMLQDRPWWAALRASDGVLTVDIEEVEASLPEPFQLPVAAEASSDRRAPRADPRVAFIARLAMHRRERASRGDPMPRGLAWAARSVGLEASTAVTPVEGWMITGTPGIRDVGGLLVRPGATSDFVLLAPRAPDEEGTTRVALELATELDAAAVWWARRRARGMEPRIGGWVFDGDPVPRLLREVFRPAPGRLGRALAVRRMSTSVVDLPTAVLVEGREGLSDSDLELVPVRAVLNKMYAGWRRARGFDLDPPALNARQPIRYVRGLAGQGVGTLWIREDLLAEAEETIDREALERWYGLLGVPPEDAPERLRLGAREDDEETLALLLAHLETPTVESVGELTQRGRTTLVRGNIRIEISLQLEDRICVARTGTPPVPDPDSPTGCWRLP